jgi:hypothetical protein
MHTKPLHMHFKTNAAALILQTCLYIKKFIYRQL